MTDNDMLEAMRQLIREETQVMKNEIDGIKVLLDTEFRRNESLLAEGQEMILERLPDPAVQEALDARVSAIEAVVKLHNRQIQALKKAQ